MVISFLVSVQTFGTQGERGECGTPGTKGDLVQLLYKHLTIAIIFTVSLYSNLFCLFHCLMLQGPVGSEGTRGPRGLQVSFFN